MIKTKTKMKAKYSKRPSKVRSISLEEYYGAAPKQVTETKVEALLRKAIAASLVRPNSMEMDLDELDAYIIANAK